MSRLLQPLTIPSFIICEFSLQILLFTFFQLADFQQAKNQLSLTPACWIWMPRRCPCPAWIFKPLESWSFGIWNLGTWTSTMKFEGIPIWMWNSKCWIVYGQATYVWFTVTPFGNYHLVDGLWVIGSTVDHRRPETVKSPFLTDCFAA